MLISAIGQGRGFFEDYKEPRRSAVELGFFLDAPWGAITEDRRGDISVESLYPEGGLLGGSGGPSGGKTSKLATLAKARKEKAEAQKKQQQSAEGGQKASVSMLSRLSQKQSKLPTVSIPSVPTTTLDPPPAEIPENSAAKTYATPIAPPDKHSQSLDQSRRKEPKEQPLPGPIEKEPIPVFDLRAGPSKFALSMFGDRITSSYEIGVTDARVFSLPGVPPNPQTTAFAGPSPDDIVAAAQSSSKGSEFSLPWA